MSAPTSSNIRVHLALILVSVIYGVFSVIIKLLLRELDQSQLIFMRLVFTAIIVGGVELFYFKTRFHSLKDFGKVSALAVIGVLFVQVLVICGIGQTTAFHASLLISTIPIFTLIFDLILKRDAFHPQKVAGIFIAFLGVALLLFIKNPTVALPANYLWGDTLILGQSVCFALLLIGSQSLLEKYGSFSMMAYYYIISAIVFTVAFGVGGFTGFGNFSFGFLSHLSLFAWGLIAYVVLFASIGSYTLNNFALARTTASTVAVYIFIQPILSAILGAVLLGEPFTPSMGIAGLIIFSGVLLATWGKQGRKTKYCVES